MSTPQGRLNELIYDQSLKQGLANSNAQVKIAIIIIIVFPVVEYYAAIKKDFIDF